MYGPKDDCDVCSCAWCIIIVFTAIFLLITGKWFYEKYIYFFILYLWMFIMLVTALLFTTCTDPGIIPRRPIL